MNYMVKSKNNITSMIKKNTNMINNIIKLGKRMNESSLQPQIAKSVMILRGAI